MNHFNLLGSSGHIVMVGPHDGATDGLTDGAVVGEVAYGIYIIQTIVIYLGLMLDESWDMLTGL